MRKFLIIILFLITGQSLFSQTTGWTGLGNGLDGNINAVTYYQGKLIAAGGFSGSGSITGLNNIAQWNGTDWTSLGTGMNDTVYSLAVFNGKLIAGGNFVTAGGVSALHIAQWDGTTWLPLTSGVDGEVRALAMYGGFLYVGGKFTNAGATVLNNVGYWDGNNWRPCGTGVDKDVFALVQLGTDVIVAGRFENAGGSAASKIAKWNGSTWSSVSTATFNDRIHALAVYNSNIYAGGRFTTGGGVNASYLAMYNGSSWVSVGGGVEDRVYSLAVTPSNELVVGGQHKFSSAGNSLYCNRISKWNGTSWAAFSTGMNDKVNAVYANDTAIIAAGEFTTAGGRTANKIASWQTITTYTVTGTVKYSGTGLPVTSGKIKAIRIDLYTREVLSVDSIAIQPSGTFNLTKTRRDTVDVLAFPNDIEDFVPTYYPSTTQWENAQRVLVTGNTNNINIDVIPATPISSTGRIGGSAILNFLPAGFITGNGLPFKSNTIIYAKQGSTYRKFSVSNTNEAYGMTALPPGNYEIIVNRIGYTSASANVTLSAGNNYTIDNLNFTLNPLDRVDVQNISTTVPKNFALYQNFPNPFNPETKIKFEMLKAQNVKITIFDALGKEIAVLVNSRFTPGTYQVSFDASKLTSGIYFYRLSTEDFTDTKKMALVR